MTSFLRSLLTFAALTASLAATAQGYWQQEVNHTIQVTLNDLTHELSTQQQMEYINNSPDELTFIWMHLWPNAYKNNRTALVKQQVRNGNSKLYFAPESERGYIRGINTGNEQGADTPLQFRIDDVLARTEPHPEHIDIVKLLLNEPLRPGNRVTITTEFQVKLPGDFSRLGHEGQSYQITQWYPKPAVYDRKGWHPMPYLDQGEFYSEFGTFDVSITLPENYVVGATGELQNPEEMEVLNSRASETMARTEFSTDRSFPPSAPTTKTLRYVQDRVHDFAWFADKRYHVWKGEVELPHSGRKVTTWLMFYGWKAKTWLEQGTKDINDAVNYYSLWNGDYPYSQCTAVDGALSAGGGMEYPMVTVTDASAIMHEVGHNWFYGILASNERQHPWMDEGLNTFNDERANLMRNPNYRGMLAGAMQGNRLTRTFGLDHVTASGLNLLPYQMSASRGLDQPVELPSENYTSINYGVIVYMKTASLFHYLKEFMGDNAFDDAMQAYFEKWKFKHPYPEDMQQALEESSGSKLDWFFNGIINTTRKVDVKLARATLEQEEIKVELKNESGLMAPVPVSLVDREGKILVTTWSAPFSDRANLSLPVLPNAYAVVLDAQQVVPELDRRDNQIRLHGILRKVEPVRLQPLAGIERHDRQLLHLMPALGWNTTDKWMPGLAFYNSSLIRKKVNYFLMPMFSISRGELKGMGDIHLNLFPQSGVHGVTAGVRAARFVNFEKLEPYLELQLNRGIGNTPKHELSYRYTHINETFGLRSLLAQGDFAAHTLSYGLSESNAIRAYGAKVTARHYRTDPYLAPGPLDGLESFRDKAFLLQGEANYSFNYRRKQSIRIRAFGGRFFEGTQRFAFGLSGSPDYLKETIFLDRAMNNSFLMGYQHQTDNRDGGFKAFVPGGFAHKWLTTINLEIDLPKLPLRLFADAGMGSNSGASTTFSSGLLYDAGFSLPILKNVLEVYFPVVGSNYELSGTSNSHLPENLRDFRNNIRFSLNLTGLNPFKIATSSFE